MKRFAFASFCALVLYGCISGTTNPFSTTKSSFTKSIFPKDSFWLNIKLKNDTLNHFSSIENGADSFVFRFWVDEQLIEGKHLFEIKFTKGHWINSHYFWVEDVTSPKPKAFYTKWLNRPVKNDSLLVCHSFELMPENFLSIFKKHGLMELPTQASLKKYTGCCLDGVVYYYEIATTNSYRFVIYENPECCKDKDPGNNIFLSFLDDFKSLLKPCEYRWPMCKIRNAKTK